MTKKLMALLLAVLMAVSLLPMPAMAGDAQVITDLSGNSAGGSYVVDKSVKDIVLSAPLTLDKDVTLELTGQTVTLKLADGESYADASVFHVESGSLTLKGSGTVKVPDNASGVVVAKDAAVTISGEVGISGGASGVKAVVGASGVKIRVNTLGKIESANGINLSGASGEIKIASGTVKGSVCAIAPDKDNALTLDKMLDGSTLYIGGTAATEEQLAAAPTAEMTELVFDDGKAPALTISSAVRTSETEGSVTFTASKAGTYYYQLDGEPASAADIMKDEAKAELVRGANTISLKDLDANAHTVYIAAKDAFGHTTELLTAAIPAVLAAPTAPVWDGKKAAWTGVEGVNDYTVQLYLGSDAYGDPIPVNGASATDDLSDVMKDDGVYTFAVRSVGANTVGAWSERSAETVRDTAAPILTVPADGVKRTAQDTATVAFVSSEDGKLYYVLNDDAADVFTSGSTMALTKGEGNTLTLTGLADSAAVVVRYAAEDSLGNRGEVQTVTVPLYLAAPATLTWVNGTSTAMWSEVPGAASYCVQLYKDGAEVTPAVTADTTSYTFTLEESGSYTFKVQAVNGDILSAWSEASGALAIDKTAPAISGESASRTDASNGSVTFTSDEAGKAYYIVGGEKPTQDALLASANVKDIASGETKIDLSGLGAEATNVYLMVVDAAGNRSDVKTVKVPVYLAKPTTITWVNNTATAMWNAVSGAEAYNIQLLRDGSDYGNVIVVNGGSTTTSDLAPHMNDDGVYTFRVQAAAAGTQSEWSDASATSYKRDTQKPTIKGEPSKRIDAKTAEFYFTSSEDGTYYYMVGSVNGGVPTAEQIADDKNPHGGCTNVRTTINLKDIADTNARKVYVVVRDKSGNLSDVFTITIPAYSAQPTPTPTPAPTATPTSAPTTYTVTLQGGTGYTIAATGGSKSPVNAGGSFSFTVTPSNGYTRGNGFSVKANGTTLTSNNGVYTISNINANQTVSVSGIVKSQNTGGGTLPAAPAITTTTLAAATMGKEYRQQITATGGTPITWSYSGTLPDGMTLAANTGILSGTPTQEGSFRFAVKATNSTGFSTRQMTLVVAGSEYTVTKGANSEWTQGGDKGIEFSGSGKGTFTVKVDGAAVAAGKYTASADGSTVTLKPEYLDTLAAGSHTVTLVYGDGSAKAKFTIKAKDKTVAPTVSSQPASASVNADSSATFTVTASGTTPLLCQWQVDKNDGSGWTDISGAVNASYTVEKVTAEQNGWKYRCVIKNAAGSVESNAATLTVKEAIGDVKKNDDTKDTTSSGGLGRILLITGIIVAVLALGAGLYFYFRRRSASRYTEDDTAWRR
ncbi:MAG: putative Ig domain-containing protein [Christensenellaceae bacterium]